MDNPEMNPSDPTDNYDPARRRRSHRRGRMPPALRRYWATHRRGRRSAALYDTPRRRRRRIRRHRLDPGRRRRRRFHLRIPRLDPGRRRRRHFDPSIRGISPFWSAILTPIGTILGSVGHNYLTVKQGKMAGAITLPMNAKITHIGLGGVIASTLLGYFGRGPFTDFLAHVAAGAAAEGFNVPTVENISRPEGSSVIASSPSLTPTPYVPAEASWYR